MLKYFATISLQTRLLLLVLIGFMLIILASTQLTRGFLQNEYRQAFYQQEQRVLSNLASRLESELNRQHLSLQALADQMVKDQAWLPLSVLERQLEVALISGTFVDYLLLDAEGVAFFDLPFFPERIGTDYSDRPFIQQTLQSLNPIRSQPFSGRRTHRPLIAFTAPVLWQDQLLGLLVGTHELTNNAVLQEIRRDFLLEAGNFYILDSRNNKFVAATDPEQLLQPLDSERRPDLAEVLQASELSGQITGHDGRNWVYSKASIPSMNWELVLKKPEYQVVATADKLLQQYLIMKLLMLGISAAMLLLMIRLMLRPVRRALDQLRQIVASDQAYQPLEVKAQGEIGQLMQAFNSLQAWRDRKERLVDEFVSIISHELRTPLTSIQGTLSLLLNTRDQLSEAQQQELLTMAQRNSQRLGFLVDDLLDMAALKSGHLQVKVRQCELKPLIDESCAQVACPLHQHKQHLQVLGLTPDYWVEADPQRLQQVLTNLLTNASKFSPEGSLIKLQVDQESRGVALRVIDQGPGIPPQDQKRIFQRFTQGDASTHRVQSGAGLGLAIAYELTLAMGGSLQLDSELSRGSCFTVWLPKATADQGKQSDDST